MLHVLRFYRQVETRGRAMCRRCLPGCTQLEWCLRPKRHQQVVKHHWSKMSQEELVPELKTLVHPFSMFYENVGGMLSHLCA